MKYSPPVQEAYLRGWRHFLRLHPNLNKNRYVHTFEDKCVSHRTPIHFVRCNLPPGIGEVNKKVSGLPPNSYVIIQYNTFSLKHYVVFLEKRPATGQTTF